MAKSKLKAISFEEGELIDNQYRILERLGGGWEGAVYKVREEATGIERAIKFFLPLRNQKNKTAKTYAKKLHKLRNCSLVIQYITQDKLIYDNEEVNFLVSDYVEGETLRSFIKKQKGKRLSGFESMNLLYELVKGIEEIHSYGEYHGDLHWDNVVIERYGVGFKVKILDFFNWGYPKAQDLKDDIVDLVHLFYLCLGGQKHYKNLHPEYKYICCGLKKSFILGKFKYISQLRVHLENIEWD